MSTVDGNDALKCSLCKDFFEIPKFLTGCGHLFCLQCLQLFYNGNAEKTDCPTCMTPTTLGADGLEGLTTCTSIAEKVMALKKSQKSLSFADTCPHDEPVSTLCPHCKIRYCNACLLTHKQQLKAESIALGRKANERFAAKSKEFEKMIGENRIAMFQNSVSACQAEIKSGMTEIWEAVSSLLDQKQAACIEVARKVVSEKIASATKILEKAKSNVAVANHVVPLVQAKPLMKYKPSDLAELLTNITRLLEDIEKAEKLTKSDFVSHLVFSLDSAAEQVYNAINELMNESCLKTDLTSYRTAAMVVNLHNAAQRADLAEVKRLLNEPGLFEDIVEHHDETNFRRTILHQAAACGSLELVKYLVEEKHAKMDAVDIGKAPPYLIAAATGNADIVAYLLGEMEKQQDPERQESAEIAAIQFSIVSGQAGVVEVLLNRNPNLLKFRSEGGETLLHCTVAFCGNPYGQLLISQMMVDRGVDVAAVDSAGNNVLHLACKHGLLGLASFFNATAPELALVKNYANETPYDLAVAGHFPEIVAQLTTKLEPMTQPGPQQIIINI